MKKHKGILCIIMIVTWCLAMYLLFILNSDDKTDKKTFTNNVTVAQDEDKIGAKIWLKEAIHGTKGITYRYIVKTDCPKWDFETRYMTDKPIEWVKDETSAVEVIIYDTQIRYNGTVYASGQYYIVPILDNIASEDVSLEDWNQSLINEAYQTYTSEQTPGFYVNILKIWIIVIPILLLFFIKKEA